MTTITTKLNPRVTSVDANTDFTLLLTFNSGEKRLFDMAPYIGKSPFFKELEDVDYFLQARSDLGTVVWPHGQDLCPDTLYLDSVSEVEND